MELRKLYRLLVVGGAVLSGATSCGPDDGSEATGPAGFVSGAHNTDDGGTPTMQQGTGGSGAGGSTSGSGAGPSSGGGVSFW